ncbi:MHYT domain-containing protein [Sphingomonas sp. MMS24-J13]|uniref:MHYT domain-containing protein n=1 Tax=Sphingomonas sp. MMS24-J13 TaxID=3238686 RepID=UPI00384F9154
MMASASAEEAFDRLDCWLLRSFPLWNLPSMILTGTHDQGLVIVSILIAIAASFTALSLAGRLRASNGWMRRVWLGAAAIALGGGIWSMHFVAMLAFRIPGMQMNYSLSLTLLSLVIALAFTAGGFAVMNWEKISRGRIAGAGLLMGSGVVAMHYLGMTAMRMPARLSYEPFWLATSVLIAVGAAIVALWLAARDQTPGVRLVASGVMGLAIAGMHYAGMRAAIFTALASGSMPSTRANVGQTSLAVLISVVTLIILLMALGAARLERLFRGFARREQRIALRLKIADVLRGRQTDEALQEIAALMGAHFAVARAGYGQLDPAEDIFDYDVCWTDGSVPPLIGRFPAAAFGVKIVAALNAGETVVVDDLLESQLSDEARTRDTAREVDTRAILVVPFVRDGRLRTIIYLNNREPRHWDPEDVTFMEEIAERTRLVIERAAVEEQLRDLNSTLESRVEARTIELRQAQDALFQSQKMEAVGQLVAGLAHDFNNVLGAIVGAFDLIGRRPEDADRVRRFADAGLQAAERGAKLTAQLLAFSRSQRIQLQPLYVCDVIDGLRDMLARMLGPMVALEFQLNPAPVPVRADPTQIEMMVLNLAINARDAMPDGGRVRITTTAMRIRDDPELDDGDFVELAVSDTGIGMDAATLSRAMEPFFTTKPVGKGTGLGLAQIYGSVRQAGGAVRIESRLGEGTTVRVLLPCTDEMPAPPEPAAALVANSLGWRPKVLLVDDDRDVRSMLASALDAQGYLVDEAEDGEAALNALEARLPDIAVLDFAMPGMNGAELARRIAERWPALPIVFASGFADTDAIQAVAGADVRMLRKPFRVNELFRTLENALGKDEESHDSVRG